MNVFFIIAAALSALTWAIHVFAGGRFIARPLLDSNLADVPKFTHYYCWHIVSIVLAFMPVGFCIGAAGTGGRELVLMTTALAAAFAVWSLVLVVWKRQSPLRLPQWALFLPIAIFGSLGLWL